MDVIIVGGSLAGLCTGIVLNRLGHNVTILERNPASAMEDGGAGMSAVVFYPDLIPTLKKLGTSGNPLIDFLSTYDRTNSPYYRNVPGWISQILNRDGSVKVSKHYEWLVAAATSWDLLYNILRANFGGGHEGGFINAAPKESGDGKTEYIYGTRVTSIKEINDMVEVELVSIDGKTDSRKCNLLIGADGASSTVRRLLLPEVERTYTGYVTWRGTIERDGLSSQTVKTLGDGLTQFYCKGNQVVHYPIPGHKGAVSAEKQYFNTVWYTNYAINSPEFRDLFTDTSGKPHKFSLPPDSIRPDLIAAQKEIAKKLLPPQLSEVFNKIEKPFVTAITDSFSSKARFLNGKVFLVGDAIVGLRPHTAVGSTQVALHALLLHRVFKKDPEMTVEEWEESVYGWGREAYELGLEMGNLSQFGNHPMADDS